VITADRVRFVLAVIGAFLITPVLAPTPLYQWRTDNPGPARTQVQVVQDDRDCAATPGGGRSWLLIDSPTTGVQLLPDPTGPDARAQLDGWLTDRRADFYGWCS
jgi:hypothetical protein